MAKTCAVTKKTSLVVGGYSNRTRATQFNHTGKKRSQPNMQKRRIFVPELNETVVAILSTQGFRTLKKNGAYKTLKEANLI
jgi:ribosomal protein L28